MLKNWPTMMRKGPAIENERWGLLEQLSHTPEVETKNRKPLERPASFGATWELRFGPRNSFRVFYEVHREEKVVAVLAIGVRVGNRLVIGGQEFEL
ncbi:MAG: type II toxin-antitoxin system RelE family toxin [Alphaproteobacteria bacterium]